MGPANESLRLMRRSLLLDRRWSWGGLFRSISLVARAQKDDKEILVSLGSEGWAFRTKY